MKGIHIFLFLILFFLSIDTYCQEINRRKVVYAELLGSAVTGSVNYDFRFKPGNDGFGMRTGLGFVPKALIIPIELNRLTGKNRIAFEYGAGVSAAIFLEEVGYDQTFLNDLGNFGFIGYAKAGIRLTPKDNGVFFNLNWNPIINTVETRWVWFGLGIGYSWN
ncbi:MAG: hypothetical protein ACLFQA_04515 [Bacteroidales bacterium]